jgi:hypothetical protein
MAFDDVENVCRLQALRKENAQGINNERNSTLNKDSKDV